MFQVVWCALFFFFFLPFNVCKTPSYNLLKVMPHLLQSQQIWLYFSCLIAVQLTRVVCVGLTHTLLCLPVAWGCSQFMKMSYCYPGRGGTHLLTNLFLCAGMVQEQNCCGGVKTLRFIHVFAWTSGLNTCHFQCCSAQTSWGCFEPEMCLISSSNINFQSIL